jgi:SAM-dependent methyltransferase
VAHVFWPRRNDPSEDLSSARDGRLERLRYRSYLLRAYDWMGAYQFDYLVRQGLREGDTLLDIGCGSLRGGRLFIPYLLPGRYHGIEPELALIEEGLAHELGTSILDVKRPTFLIDANYTCSAFGRSFDYLLAHSVFAHTPLSQMRRCLAEARACMTPTSVFAASFTPGASDYTAERWGRATYRPETIRSEAAAAGLTCVWDEVHPYGQQWVHFFVDGDPHDRASSSALLARWVEPSLDAHVRILRRPDGWPDAVEFAVDGRVGKTCRLWGPGVGQTFRSDFRHRAGWHVHTYGATGGLETGREGGPAAGVAGRYESGHAMDHLASEFLDVGAGAAALAFFSIWVKPDRGDGAPVVSLQGDDFSDLGRARHRTDAEDGWMYMAGWARTRGVKRVRMLIQQPFATACLLRQAALVVADEEAWTWREP